MSSTAQTISTEKKQKSTKTGSKKTGGKKTSAPKSDLPIVEEDNVEPISTDLMDTDLQFSNISSNEVSLEDILKKEDFVQKVESQDFSEEMDVVLKSGETSDDENHSEKTDENNDSPTKKEKKPRLTKMQKLQLDAQKCQDVIQEKQAELSEIIKKISELDVSGKKANKEPRTQISKIVQPTSKFLSFMKHLSSKEETPIFTKKTIESMINNYVKQENLFVTFGSDADDKETRSEMRNKELEKRGINTSSFNKPFNLDENLKTLFKGVEGIPTEYVLYSHITKYSSNLFTEIVTEK